MNKFSLQEEPDEIPGAGSSEEESQDEEHGLHSLIEEASVRVPSIPDPKQ